MPFDTASCSTTRLKIMVKPGKLCQGQLQRFSSRSNPESLSTAPAQSETPVVDRKDRKAIKQLLKTAKKDSMIIGFTCNCCSHRQFKQMSKVAYSKGVVIIICDGCNVKHLISDNLGWFDTLKFEGTIEQIMERKGLKVDKLEYLPDETG